MESRVVWCPAPPKGRKPPVFRLASFAYIGLHQPTYCHVIFSPVLYALPLTIAHRRPRMHWWANCCFPGIPQTLLLLDSLAPNLRKSGVCFVARDS